MVDARERVVGVVDAGVLHRLVAFVCIDFILLYSSGPKQFS